MKIFKTFLLLLLGIVMGISGALGFYYLTVGELAWQAYVEEKLIPNAVFVISSISTIAILCSPFIKKILLAAERFTQATTEVSSTDQNGKQLLRTTEEMMEEFRKLRNDVETSMATVKTTTDNIERVVHLGFEHESQLVADGWAKEIAKVGNENESGQ